MGLALGVTSPTNRSCLGPLVRDRESWLDESAIVPQRGFWRTSACLYPHTVEAGTGSLIHLSVGSDAGTLGERTGATLFRDGQVSDSSV